MFLENVVKNLPNPHRLVMCLTKENCIRDFMANNINASYHHHSKIFEVRFSFYTYYLLNYINYQKFQTFLISDKLLSEIKNVWTFWCLKHKNHRGPHHFFRTRVFISECPYFVLRLHHYFSGNLVVYDKDRIKTYNSTIFLQILSPQNCQI